MKVWQIASGNGARDYSQVFLDHDVMLIGPGDFGPYNQKSYQTAERSGQIRAFVEDPVPGDLVLLRHGMELLAVGIIPAPPNDGYEWHDYFDDVLGWDLNHCRRVQWETSAQLVGPFSGVFTSRQARAFSAYPSAGNVARLTRVARLFPHRNLKALPVDIPRPLTHEQLGPALFSAGLPNKAVDDVLQTLQRNERLTRWYRSQGASCGRPTEHEIVAHMLVPLMLGLGWSEQLVAVEWKSIDMAFFRETPTTSDACIMICEAKQPGQSFDDAYAQARNYASGLPNCRRIVVTDGHLVFTYLRDGSWPTEPTGYVNLVRIRQRNLIPTGTSGVDTLVDLVPWNAMRS